MLPSQQSSPPVLFKIVNLYIPGLSIFAHSSYTYHVLAILFIYLIPKKNCTAPGQRTCLSWSPSNSFRLTLLLAKEDFFLKPSLPLYLKISNAMTDQISLPYFVIFLLSPHHCHTVLFFFFFVMSTVISHMRL